MRIVGVSQRREVFFQHVIVVGQVVVILEQARVALVQRLDDFRGVLLVQLNHALELGRRPGLRGGGWVGRRRRVEETDAAQEFAVRGIEVVRDFPQSRRGGKLEPHDDI